MPFDISKIVRPNILTLEPYRCARDDFQTGILLDANENTYGPGLARVTSREQSLELNRYPDPHQLQLKKQICAFRNRDDKAVPPEHQLTPENLCLGVGSDESIDALIRACVRPEKEKVMICPPTYGMYSICCVVNDVGIVKVPLDFKTFQIQPAEILAGLKADPTVKLVYVTSPGNPTATQIKRELILEVLQGMEEMSWNGFFLVDEAYIDFSPVGSSVCELVNEHKNLVVMQTFSKAFGLAGIRLGICYSTPELSSLLNAMKYPYNVNNITSDIALKATTSESLETTRKTVSVIIEQRTLVLSKILELKGVKGNIGGTDANFILIQFANSKGEPSNEVAEAVYSKLAVEKQVVVRFRGKEPGCKGCLRITIGTPEENRTLLKELEIVLTEVLKDN